MRKVIVGAMISMDGVMQAPGGPEEDPPRGFELGGWVAPLGENDAVFGEELDKWFAEPFDLLLGRRTYDISRRSGPLPAAGRTTTLPTRSTGQRSTWRRAKAST